MDIDKIPVGPELDILIAQKVFGCDVYSRKEGDRYGHEQRPPRLTDTWILCGCKRESGGPAPHEEPELGCGCCETSAGLWFYSTEIAAAWEIVKKLGISIAPTWNALIWYAADHFTASAETAPLAICRVALKFVTDER